MATKRNQKMNTKRFGNLERLESRQLMHGGSLTDGAETATSPGFSITGFISAVDEAFGGHGAALIENGRVIIASGIADQAIAELFDSSGSEQSVGVVRTIRQTLPQVDIADSFETSVKATITDVGAYINTTIENVRNASSEDYIDLGIGITNVAAEPINIVRDVAGSADELFGTNFIETVVTGPLVYFVENLFDNAEARKRANRSEFRSMLGQALEQAYVHEDKSLGEAYGQTLVVVGLYANPYTGIPLAGYDFVDGIHDGEFERAGGGLGGIIVFTAPEIASRIRQGRAGTPGTGEGVVSGERLSGRDSANAEGPGSGETAPRETVTSEPASQRQSGTSETIIEGGSDTVIEGGSDTIIEGGSDTAIEGGSDTAAESTSEGSTESPNPSERDGQQAPQQQGNLEGANNERALQQVIDRLVEGENSLLEEHLDADGPESSEWRFDLRTEMESTIRNLFEFVIRSETAFERIVGTDIDVLTNTPEPAVGELMQRLDHIVEKENPVTGGYSVESMLAKADLYRFLNLQKMVIEGADIPMNPNGTFSPEITNVILPDPPVSPR